MVVEVLFLPQVATALQSRLCVVIDVLRATSTAVAMFEAGAARINLAGSVEDALALAASAPTRPLVCGEVGGLAPAGFDLGNSPREYIPGSFLGKELVFFTSNGTKAMRQLTSAPVVLCGSLLNASAVAAQALSLARERSLEIAFVCSGDYLGTRFAIDDAFCAGYLCSLVEKLSGTPMPVGTRSHLSDASEEGARETVEVVSFDESALAAMRLYRSYLAEAGASLSVETPPSEATLRVFWESHNAQVLGHVGLSEDVEYCAQVDISPIVPRLAVEGDALVIYPS